MLISSYILSITFQPIKEYEPLTFNKAIKSTTPSTGLAKSSPFASEAFTAATRPVMRNSILNAMT
jgi:hypothetical protein